MPTLRPRGRLAGSVSGRRPHAAPRARGPVSGPPTGSELLHAIPGGVALALIGWFTLVTVLAWLG